MKLTAGIILGAALILTAQRSWRHVLVWALSRGDT